MLLCRINANWCHFGFYLFQKTIIRNSLKNDTYTNQSYQTVQNLSCVSGNKKGFNWEDCGWILCLSGVLSPNSPAWLERKIWIIIGAKQHALGFLWDHRETSLITSCRCLVGKIQLVPKIQNLVNFNHPTQG